MKTSLSRLVAGAVVTCAFASSPVAAEDAAVEREIVPAAATPANRLVIALETNDLIYDSLRNQLIVSIPGRNDTIGNSVVTIDATTGAVGPATFVGSEPGKLALSADGSMLYVGLNGAGSVAQLNWQTKTIIRTMPLGPGYAGPLQAEDIEIVPNDPTRVVVSKRDPHISPGFMGLVVFDDGVALPNTTSSHTGSSVIEFGASPSRLYGYNHYHTGFEFYLNTVDANGVTANSSHSGLISGFSTDIEFAGGRVYSSIGQIIDPEAHTTIGTLNANSSAFAIDAAAGRASFLKLQSGSTTGVLEMFNTTTFLRVGEYSVSGLAGGPATLRRTGANRFAARMVNSGSGQVVLIDANTPGGGDPGDPDPTDGTGEFTALPPHRILDTRAGLGMLGGEPSAIGQGEFINVQVAGNGGVPIAGAWAVVLNATVTGPTSSGYVTIWPAGQSRPLISSLNFVPGLTVPNLVTVALGAFGQISAFNAFGQSDLLLDVVGYYSTPNGPLGARYFPLTPARLVDTRAGRAIGPGEMFTLKVSGVGAVPTTGVTAVTLNVTAADATATSYLTVYPADRPRPNASNLNFVPGQAVPNLVVVKVSADGYVRIFNESGSVHVIADIMGYYKVDSSTEHGRLLPVNPFRLYDSRLDEGGPLRRNETVVFGGDTTSFTALVLNVTAVAPTAPGYLTVYPYPGTRPLASNLNFEAGQTVPNAVFVRIGPKFAVYNAAAGTTDILIDVFGIFT